MNNIFDFATSELSQDAVICWILNWYNNKQSKLYPLALELLKKFVEFDEKTDTEISIYKQFSKIDIMVIFNSSKKIVIVEDKVDTSEHDDQINRYKETLSELKDEDKVKIGISNTNEYSISTVYFKTGFFYNEDILVKVDKVVDGKTFLKVIKPYKDANYILQMYCDYLERLILSCDENGMIDRTEKESFWEWNICKYQIAQYNLMRYIFPEGEWDKTWRHMVYHGCNVGGRPWTERVIYYGKFPGSERDYTVFWRIDTDNNGPYISLRFYDGGHDKKDEQKKQEHIVQYELHKKQLIEILDSKENGNMWEWKEVNPGERKNYKEAALLTVHTKDILKDWDNQKDKFARKICYITNEFLRANS